MTSGFQYELNMPKGWMETTIEKICTNPQYGYTTKAVECGSIKLLRTTDITSGKINWDSVPYCLENPKEPEKYFLKKGDIVISRAGSVGVNFLINNPEKAVFASYLIRFNPLIDNKFFKFFLDSPFYWNNISEKKLGIAVPNVNATKLKTIRFPLPSFPEQHRIVAKIEELFSDLDNGIENLKKAQTQLRTYRQAVLKYAFEGKLTEEWRTLQRRAGNPPEPAEKLLEQIKKEREKHYQKQLEDWQKVCEQANIDGKKKPGKPKKPKELPPITEKELADLPMLPEAWIYFKSEGLSDFITKGTTPKKDELFDIEGDVPFIKVYNLTNKGVLNFSINPTFVSKKTHNGFLLRSVVFPGDVLMNIVGPPLGKVSLVPHTYKEWNINQAIVRYRPDSILYNKFLQYYLLSNATINNMIRKSKATAGQFNLTLEICRNLEIPLCSPEEQHAIVQEIESRLSVCDKLEQTIEDSLKKSEALRQSILKKAFVGELTKDWREKHPELITGENSAEKLLEKIRLEKALASAERGKSQSKKTKKK